VEFRKGTLRLSDFKTLQLPKTAGARELNSAASVGEAPDFGKMQRFS
jgi:hypothetical protein